jgi:hypothetical protein
MVYNTQNYWVFRLCPLSGILKTRKRFGNWFCFCPQLRGETPILSGPLERANLSLDQGLRLGLSKGPSSEYYSNLD